MTMTYKFLFIAGVIIILLGVAVILFSGKRFTDAYLKNLGGEEKFDYRKWKFFFVLSVMLYGIAAILWSFGSISGPILAIAALLTRPVLTFTVCRKKD